MVVNMTALVRDFPAPGPASRSATARKPRERARAALVTLLAGAAAAGVAIAANAGDLGDSHRTGSIVDLGALLPAGASSSIATAITQEGLIAGAAQLGLFGGHTPVIWGPDGVEIVSDGSGAGRFATGISADGTLVGTREGNANGWVAVDGTFLCVADPEWCNNLTFFFYGSSQVLDIAENGLFTGGITITTPTFSSTVEAFIGIVGEDGSVVRTPLGLFGDKSTVGRGVNTLGEVVGWSVPYTDSRALWFTEGAVVALPDLGGTYNRGDAISESAVAVGYVSLPGAQNAFLSGVGAYWHLGEQPMLTTIGQLGTSIKTSLSAVNGAGVAVGEARFDVLPVLEQFRAIIFSPSAGLANLNTLVDPESGWTLETAESINDAGFIVGSGRLEGVPGRRAYLFVPDPIERDPIDEEPEEEGAKPGGGTPEPARPRGFDRSLTRPAATPGSVSVR